MKRFRIYSAFLCLLLLFILFSGCTPSGTGEGGGSTLHIVTTVFPEYDWVRELTKGTDNEIRLLLDHGVDLHSYQPTAADMIDISTCDLFIYVGGESDAWVEDALSEAVNQDMKVICLLDVLGDAVKEEEAVVGMEEELEDEAAYDEHVWLSLKNAGVLCSSVASALSELDPANQALYAENLSAYTASLNKLDNAYQHAVDEAPQKTVLFGDRFPFRYLADDYSLTYYAAFPGCSAETEASFETVVFLAKKVDELHLPVILTTESSDGSIAETVKKNTKTKDQTILSLNSMQSVTQQEMGSGVTYLSLMEQNLEVLKEALR